jgi:hypothetical protein
LNFYSNNLDEIKRVIAFEFSYPEVPKLHNLTNLNMASLNASVFVGVVDDKLPEAEQDQFLDNFRSAREMVEKELGQKLVFSWMTKSELGEHDLNHIELTPGHFVMIKEPDANWYPNYFLYPGIDCYNKINHQAVSVSSAEDMAKFARGYLNGQFIPSHLRNENV